MIDLEMGNWRRLRQLSWRQQLQLLQAAFLLPSIALGLRLAGLQRTFKLLSAFPHRRRTALDDQAELARSHDVARIVQAAATHGPYHASCLPRALTLWWLLQRQGIAAELRIGVRKEAGRLLGHAWIEYRAHVVGDDSDIGRRFAPFDGISDRLSAVTF